MDANDADNLEGRTMDWLERMKSTMDHIETNLANNISYDDIAQIACCSTYHFQRMFPFITGITLTEYIRRRRLTLAAFELQTTNARVIDVAMKYGYQSPEAFARAFKNLHGIMPISARDKGVVEGQEHGPIEVAILAAFLFYRYKFLSQAKDKNLYRLPYWTRT